MKQRCFFCQQEIEPIHVHGHYECPVCHTNIMPCCDGDNCDTNLLLKNHSIGSADRITGRLEE
jgi:predicted RNA-binding Zn-ribbon protein involved in translation (DUF1610 family)